MGNLKIKKIVIFTCKKVGPFLIGVVGFISGYLTLTPRLSIISLDSLNPRNPFSTPFQLSNDGLFRINDIITTLEIDSIKSESMQTRIFSIAIGNTGIIKSILPGDKATFFCRFPFDSLNNNLSFGEIHILVEYKQEYWPFKKKRWFRFKTETDSNNKLHWLQFPINNKSQVGPMYAYLPI